MSLTGVSPLINSWIKQKLEWRWYWRPVVRPFTIPAGGQVQIPSGAYTFSAAEGTLLTFNGVFDHPACGIRAETGDELDTGSIFTPGFLTLVGLYNTPMYVTALIPPRTLPGIYGISQSKEWPWTEWARLYLFNSDSVPHTCLKYSYTMAVLKNLGKEGAERRSQ